MRMKKLLCLGLAAAIACTSLPPMGGRRRKGRKGSVKSHQEMGRVRVIFG